MPYNSYFPAGYQPLYPQMNWNAPQTQTVQQPQAVPQQAQQLLNSGRVSQEQYNQAMQMAQQLQRMMGGK